MHYQSKIDSGFYYPFLKFKLLSVRMYKRYTKTHYVERTLRKIFFKAVKEGYLSVYSPGHMLPHIYYPTKKLVRRLELKPKSMYINENELMHDSIVSHLALAISLNSKCEELIMEHEFKSSKTGDGREKLPDFYTKINENGELFDDYYEIELTAKNKDRVVSKLDSYAKNSACKRIIYIFTNLRIMRKYLEYFKEVVELENKSKFYFLHIKNPAIDKYYIDSMKYIVFQEKENFEKVKSLFISLYNPIVPAKGLKEA